MHVCAVLDEQLHNVRVSIAGCLAQCKMVTGVHVCSVPEEELDDLQVAA